MTPPRSLRIRMYNVGFGDSFLLTFRYDDGNRNVLIDLGSRQYPPDKKNVLKRVAEQIQAECDGHLQVLVATHRHQDHISGFGQKASGGIIAGLKPQVVIQPWTEDPRAAKDATVPPDYGSGAVRLVNGLASVHDAAQMLRTPDHFPDVPEVVRRQLTFIGENSVSNKAAVRNLLKMGKKTPHKGCHYVYFKDDPKPHADLQADIEREIPGVDVYVLGPPTLEDAPDLKGHDRYPDELWLEEGLSLPSGGAWPLPASDTQDAVAADAETTARSNRLFRDAECYEDDPSNPDPLWSRWFKRHIRSLQAENLLRIAQSLDRYLNNTSVILLFRVGETGILFPGDAEVESWMYALERSEVCELLKQVRVYKVGHHGSRNATPKTLWDLFHSGQEGAGRGGRYSLNSTLSGVYGESEETSVPHGGLVSSLQERTNLITTDGAEASWLDLEIDFTTGEMTRPEG